MSNNPTALVQKLWNYCNILRDDGLSFRLRQGFDGQDGDYVERLTFLLLPKTADEKPRSAWKTLRKRAKYA